MMSKNSFLTSMIENIKRRSFVPLFSFVLFFFYFPVALTVLIQRALQQQQEWPEAGFQLETVYAPMFQMNLGIMIVVIGIALLCAIQGYSYLYHRDKVDLYHSVPISKQRRFWIIYLNGILFYVVPYLVNMLLGYVVVAMFGQVSILLIKASVLAFLGNLLFFLCIYHIAILAVMMTGNVIMTILGAGVFLLYEILARNLIVLFCEEFYDTFQYLSSEALLKTWFAPIQTQYLMIEKITSNTDLIGALFSQAMLAILFGVLAYFAYRKRPSEACGKMMAFEKSKGIIKVALVVLVSIFSAWVFSSWTYENNFMGVLGLVLGLLLSHAVIELIYERELKAILRKTRQMLFAAVVSVFLVSIFQFDLLHYDTYVPEKEKVASVGVFLEDNYFQSYINEEGMRIDSLEHCLKNVQMSEVDNVLLLAEEAMLLRGNDTEDTDPFVVNVSYTLTNGKQVYRQYVVDRSNPKIMEVLNKISQNEDYQMATIQMFGLDFFEDPIAMEATFGRGGEWKEQKIPQEQYLALLEVYREELRSLDFYTRTQEFPIGELIFERYNEINRGYETWQWEYPVYESFSKTISLLKQMGCDVNYQLKAEDVRTLTIIDYNEINQRQPTEVLVESREQIEELLPFLYPSGLSHYSYQNVLNNMEAEISLSEEASDAVKHYAIKAENAPKWLKELLSTSTKQ